MTLLQHIVEPERLLLTWQPADENGPDRKRRVVGEICDDEGGQFVFRYLTDTQDYKEARQAGFQGYPAFSESDRELRDGVRESFMRRLPPPKREDFAKYLEQHRLPFPFPLSDLALLGYTGARLPSDSFALVPVFSPDQVPCDFVLEVAGLRHTFQGDLESIRDGDRVAFEPEPSNSKDPNALLITHGDRHLGYVNRVLVATVRGWLARHNVAATVERINGKPHRPLVYVRVSVS